MSSGWNTPKPVEYEGVVYPSLTALAKKYGLDKSSVSYRPKHGIPLDRPIRSGRWSPCEHDGRKYLTLTDFAEAMGLSKDKAKYLINTSGKWLEK